MLTLSAASGIVERQNPRVPGSRHLSPPVLLPHFLACPGASSLASPPPPLSTAVPTHNWFNTIVNPSLPTEVEAAQAIVARLGKTRQVAAQSLRTEQISRGEAVDETVHQRRARLDVGFRNKPRTMRLSFRSPQNLPPYSSKPRPSQLLYTFQISDLSFSQTPLIPLARGCGVPDVYIYIDYGIYIQIRTPSDVLCSIYHFCGRRG